MTDLALNPLEAVGTSRRRFLQGAAAATGAVAVLPTWLASAASASPLGADEGMVVVVTLLGGNDWLNTIVPRTGARRTRYDQLRPGIAIPTSSLLALDADWGFHAKLPKLAARYQRGQVAVVQGVGLPSVDMSHFSATDEMRIAHPDSMQHTGWIGRYLDDVTGWDDGLAGVAVGTTTPLHLIGRRAEVTAVPNAAAQWASDSTAPWDRVAQDALRAFVPGGAELGPWGEALADANVDAMDRAARVNPVFATALPSAPLQRDLVLAARILNAGTGTRVVAVELNGWDTHAEQLSRQSAVLGQLDIAIESFFATLAPTLASRTTVVVVSEFGRRAAVNGSAGTDHGHGGGALVIGSQVQGGLVGEPPSLDTLDSAGNLKPTVDYRSLYATVLSAWLGADDAAVLGATYPQLPVFKAGPGATVA